MFRVNAKKASPLIRRDGKAFFWARDKIEQARPGIKELLWYRSRPSEFRYAVHVSGWDELVPKLPIRKESVFKRLIGLDSKPDRTCIHTHPWYEKYNGCCAYASSPDIHMWLDLLTLSKLRNFHIACVKDEKIIGYVSYQVTKKLGEMTEQDITAVRKYCIREYARGQNYFAEHYVLQNGLFRVRTTSMPGFMYNSQRRSFEEIAK